MWFGNDFLATIPKEQGTKAKVDKWDYVNLKKFCTVKQQNKKAIYRKGANIFIPYI